MKGYPLNKIPFPTFLPEERYNYVKLALISEQASLRQVTRGNTMLKTGSCKQCGHPLSLADAFCPNCGAPNDPNTDLPTIVKPTVQGNTPLRPKRFILMGTNRTTRIIVAIILASATVLAAFITVVVPRLFTTPVSLPPTPTTTVGQAPGSTQPTVSVSSPQQLFTQITNRTPDLQDSLMTNGPNKWDETAQNQTDGCAFRGGAYHAYTTHPHETECFAHATNFANFALQVQMTSVAGDGGGLTFRVDSTNTEKEYRFYVSPGYYCDLFVPLNNHRHVCDDTSGSAIKKGSNQTNTITVIASGNTIYLYINGQYVGTDVDSTSSSGEIGVFAAQFKSAPTEVFFSNLKVWTF